MDELRTVCQGLGLGPLLDRMPSGLHQMVGETGWQLSHGEKCRLYIARALLQRADCVVIDEGLASLDPDTFHQVCRFVLGRVDTLVLIANAGTHP